MKAENTNTQNTHTQSRKVETIFSPQIEMFVPFAGNIDSSRLNMTSKQLTQSVVSKNTDTPLVINKDYKKMTTINSPFMEKADDDGFVIYNQENLLIIYYKNLKKLVSKYIPPVKKLVNMSLSLKYKINKVSFSKDEVLFDYSNMDIDNMLPKIGYRARTLYMQWFGYNSDDAVIISESFAKKAEVDYLEKVYIPLTKTWKYFRVERNKEEELETYFPINLPDGKLISEDLIRYNKIDAENHFIAEYSNLKDDASLFFSKNIDGIEGGKIIGTKVHLFNDKINMELNEENYKEAIQKLDDAYIYNKGLIKELEPVLEKQFEQKKKLYSSFKALGLPDDQAKEMTENAFSQYLMMTKLPKHYKQFLREKFNLEEDNIDGLIELDITITKRTTRGDKFTNLYAGKATSAMIIPDHLMPVDENGYHYDLIFNTLGIPGRNNWGTIFEAALSKVIEDIEQTAEFAYKSKYKKEAIKALKDRIEFINENFIKLYDNEYYEQVGGILSNFNEVKEDLIEDILEKGFYLFIPNFQKISYNTFFMDFVKPYFIKFDGDDRKLRKKEIEISSDFMKWLRETWNFVGPFTDTNESKIKANDGISYIIKLHHTSYSKHNAVSFTTSYSKITGQPVRGRKKGGGQHISWQSLAALLAHKEGNAVLKEFYTIKSDAIDEKENFLMKYIRDGEYYLKNKYNSVTKKTLNNSLKMFGMKFEDE